MERRQDGTPTDEEFRKTGYTAAARNYPLGEEAFRRKCAFNGVDPSVAPTTWRYAPNRYFWEYWLGKRSV